MKTISLDKAAHVGRRYCNVLRLASNVADAETVTIGNEVYEIDTDPATVVSGNFVVDCSGGVTPTIAGAALVATINAKTQQGITAKAISANEILIATRLGVAGRALACSKTLAGANNAWAAAAMYGGSDVFKGVQLQSRAVNATEVALTAMRFAFPFNPVSALVQVRTAAGAPKAWGGTTTLTGDRVDLANTGSTDLAATDVVTVFVGE
jgi:hypothetical protein